MAIARLFAAFVSSPDLEIAAHASRAATLHARVAEMSRGNRSASGGGDGGGSPGSSPGGVGGGESDGEGDEVAPERCVDALENLLTLKHALRVDKHRRLVEMLSERVQLTQPYWGASSDYEGASTRGGRDSIGGSMLSRTTSKLRGAMGGGKDKGDTGDTGDTGDGESVVGGRSDSLTRAPSLTSRSGSMSGSLLRRQSSATRRERAESGAGGGGGNGRRRSSSGGGSYDPYAASVRSDPRDAPVLRVLVAGSGPVGLRAAVEMAMLGHQVTVWERRPGPCTRLNVLKLWDESVGDLHPGMVKVAVLAGPYLAHRGLIRLHLKARGCS